MLADFARGRVLRSAKPQEGFGQFAVESVLVFIPLHEEILAGFATHDSVGPVGPSSLKFVHGRAQVSGSVDNANDFKLLVERLVEDKEIPKPADRHHAQSP